MLILESVRRELAHLPILVRLGLAGLALAGLADVVAHLEATGHAGHLHEHTSAELSAHVAAFVSMVVIQLGVVVDGVGRTRARRRAARRTSKGGT